LPFRSAQVTAASSVAGPGGRASGEAAKRVAVALCPGASAPGSVALESIKTPSRLSVIASGYEVAFPWASSRTGKGNRSPAFPWAGPALLAVMYGSCRAICASWGVAPAPIPPKPSPVGVTRALYGNSPPACISKVYALSDAN
jgi:hypothetical protein